MSPEERAREVMEGVPRDWRWAWLAGRIAAAIRAAVAAETERCAQLAFNAGCGRPACRVCVGGGLVPVDALYLASNGTEMHFDYAWPRSYWHSWFVQPSARRYEPRMRARIRAKIAVRCGLPAAPPEG